MTQSRIRIAVSWFFIVATIVIIQIILIRRNSNISSVDSASIIQIQMTGKYFVGIKQFPRQTPMLEKRLSQLEQGIINSKGHNIALANIPILAEVSGKDAALHELSRMAEDPDRVADGKNIPVFLKLYNDGSSSLDSDQLLILKDYGWVGRLALSQDKPDTDPERRKVLRSAFIMVTLMGMLTIAAVAVLLAGLVLFIIAIVQGIKGKLKSHLIIPDTQGSLLLETFAIYLVLSTVLPLLLVVIFPGFRNGGILMSIMAGLLPILWPLINGAGWKDYRTALGWNRGKGFFREVGAGIVGYIAGLPLMVVGVIVVMILTRYAGQTPTHPVVFDLSRSPLFIFLLASVYAPFTEETLFRGALYGYLRKSLPWVVSGIISSFIFAILHPQGWVAVPVLGVIGFNLSVIREWRGSTIAPMTAHALNNGSLIGILIISLA